MPDNTNLLEAFRNCKFQEAREILQEEANIPADLQPFERIQLYEKLIQYKAFDIILLFIEHKLIPLDLFDYDRFDNTVLQKILLNLQEDEADVAFLNEFLSKLDSINDTVDNQTLLGYALDIGAAPFLLTHLINHGCETHTVNNAEQTYLHQIAANNRISAEKAAGQLTLLLNEGLDVNAQDIVNKTALLTAIASNKTLLIDLLLENGASCNIGDKNEETAFYHAVIHQQNLQLYLKLREFESPDFERANKNGETILFEFLRRLNRPSETLLQLLVKMIEDGADLYTPSLYYGNEKTAADVTAEQSFVVFDRVLQLDKLEVSRVDQNGDSLLHKVCAFDVNFDNDKAKDTYRKVKLLIEKGADVNLTNNKDETPMMLASADNLKSKTVELLLTNK